MRLNALPTFRLAVSSALSDPKWMKNTPRTKLLRLTGLVSLVLSLSACGTTSNDTDTPDTTSETSTETTSRHPRRGAYWYIEPRSEYIFDVGLQANDGPGVILLHGFPRPPLVEAQLLALGEAGYRAVAPNQHGTHR